MEIYFLRSTRSGRGEREILLYLDIIPKNNLSSSTRGGK